MILYLDTSALVKAYIAEEFSHDVMSHISNADIISTHRIAFIEAHAAFAQLNRENKLTDLELNTTKQVFVNDWRNYLQIENTQALMEHAVDLAEAFALRAYDSVHLAAAAMLSKQSNQMIIFACFDRHLNKAAKVLGLQLSE